mmetsp:Transcript_16016/g.18717  ORF Transcript_16016/g.18717 Transcript_16016/m.18717 type:complete len:221 (+) Transcript_16016:278-940(+)
MQARTQKTKWNQAINGVKRSYLCAKWFFFKLYSSTRRDILENSDVLFGISVGILCCGIVFFLYRVLLFLVHWGMHDYGEGWSTEEVASKLNALIQLELDLQHGLIENCRDAKQVDIFKEVFETSLITRTAKLESVIGGKLQTLEDISRSLKCHSSAEGLLSAREDCMEHLQSFKSSLLEDLTRSTSDQSALIEENNLMLKEKLLDVNVQIKKKLEELDGL